MDKSSLPPAEHAEAIRQSLQNCALLQPVFNAERFAANLRDRAVPEAVIAEILETAGIADDEAYFRSK